MTNQLGSITLQVKDLLPILINTLTQFDPTSSNLGDAHAFQDDALWDEIGMGLIQALMDEIRTYY